MTNRSFPITKELVNETLAFFSQRCRVITRRLRGGGGGNPAADKPSRDSSVNRSPYEAPAAPSPAEQQRINDSKLSIAYPEIHKTISELQDIYIGENKILSYKTSSSGHYFDLDTRSLPQGSATQEGKTVYRNQAYAPQKSSVRSYQGFRSGAMLIHTGTEKDYDFFALSFGHSTPLANIPTTGKATYQGIALDRNDDGKLTYDVDFGRKRGSGKIEGLERYGTITLRPAVFTSQYNSFNNTYSYGGRDSATSDSGMNVEYFFRFYGDHAEEIAGQVMGNSRGIVFHGERGAITP